MNRWAASFVGLRLADITTTVANISMTDTSIEANPLMRHLLEQSMGAFLLAQALVGAVALLVASRHYERFRGLFWALLIPMALVVISNGAVAVLTYAIIYL